ncbi:MAG TPA: hypothetical protein PKI09_11230 [Dermatophilaceae bacterium]|nr:hypothetical protein [Dermatophilaceae bacterium]HPZ69393.1 hypothetical protein [Dermatophilaceae bacterium]HQD02234.1 hypothetical protein [Dermatophilaceae bacterium]
MSTHGGQTGPGVSVRATRLQRPSWRDSRLIVGIVLVLLATALGAKAVASADDRVPRYAAATTLKPGDRLDAGTIVRVDVLLDDAVAAYLSAQTPPPADSFVLREVRAGELVPVSAVGSRLDVSLQPVTVRVDGDSVAGLISGSVVDVWVSPRDPESAQERYLGAALGLHAVAVAWIPTDQGSFGVSTSSSAVTLLVPAADVQKLIAAQDARSRLTLVPVPGSLHGRGS